MQNCQTRKISFHKKHENFGSSLVSVPGCMKTPFLYKQYEKNKENESGSFLMKYLTQVNKSTPKGGQQTRELS